MNEKPVCYEKDLAEIIDLFRNSIESQDNDDINIDIDKIIQGFENELREKLEVLPDVKEKHVDENVKNKIIKMEEEANQIKNEIHIYRTNFIVNVRTQIEQDLKSKFPHIEKFEEEEDYINNKELQDSLRLLDQNINKYLQKAIDTNEAMVNSSEKYDQFEKHILLSLNGT